jgi:uncharacterized protein YpmS
MRKNKKSIFLVLEEDNFKKLTEMIEKSSTCTNMTKIINDIINKYFEDLESEKLDYWFINKKIEENKNNIFNEIE